MESVSKKKKKGKERLTFYENKRYLSKHHPYSVRLKVIIGNGKQTNKQTNTETNSTFGG